MFKTELLYEGYISCSSSSFDFIIFQLPKGINAKVKEVQIQASFVVACLKHWDQRNKS